MRLSRQVQLFLRILLLLLNNNGSDVSQVQAAALVSDVSTVAMVGLGHRLELDAGIRANASSIDCLEIISDHYLHVPPERRERLLALAQEFPLLPHGIEMSIGTVGPVDDQYLDHLARLVADINGPWASDHLAFTRAGGVALGQLTPLVRTRETAREIAAKAQHVQDVIGVPFLLENITYYVDFASELSEAEFIAEIMENCSCGLLLDVTNVYINSINHSFDAAQFLATIPLERVVQIHLAGGEWHEDTLMDSHSASVHEEAWELLGEVVSQTPSLRAVTIERDDDYPVDFQELLAEVTRARSVVARAEAE